MKSNILFVMLLFCCPLISTAALEKDTIIVDGRKVVIQKQVVDVEVPSPGDSVNAVKGRALNPRRPKSPRPVGSGFSIGVNGGASAMYSTVSTNAFDLETLPDFVNDDYSLKASPLLNFELTYHFSTQWSVGTGITSWTALVRNQYFDEADLTKDSLLGFLPLEKSRLYQFYWFAVGPGAETDTTELVLHDGTLKVKSLDIPIVLNYTFKSDRSSQKPGDGYWFVGVGFVATLYGKSSGGPFQLINEDGSYKQLKYKELNINKTSINPLLEGGIRKELSPHFEVQSSLRYILNLGPLNGSTVYQVDYKRVNISVGLRYHF